MARSSHVSAVVLFAACQAGAAPLATPPAAETPSLIYLTVFDADSQTEFMLSQSQSDRMPLRRLADRRLRLDNIRPTQVLVEGIWTVAFDIPGDEATRIEALIADHGMVFLVWQDRVLATWQGADIAPIEKRYRMSKYMINRGFSDEVTAAQVATQLQGAHSTDARAATQLGTGADGTSRRGSAP